jgi:hypothetical protein
MTALSPPSLPDPSSRRRVRQTLPQLIARATGPEKTLTGFHDNGRGVLPADCPFYDDELPDNLRIYLGDPSFFHCFGCGSRGTATKTATGYLLRSGA